MSSSRNQLLSIQYLRGIAALMVVAFHARNPVDWLFNPLTGYTGLAWGVDIFFVISGFIMYVAARGEAVTEFLGKRVIRVAPLYWLCTFALVVVITRLTPAALAELDVSHLVQSLLFVPHYSPLHPKLIEPYLIPGWTLNFEMFFYALFAIGLYLRRPLVFTSLAILVLFAAGRLLENDSAIFRTYTSPLLLEFICGVWIGALFVHGRIWNRTGGLLPLGFLLLLTLPALELGDGMTMALRILSASLIIYGAVSFGGRVPESRPLKLIGDASYSIYLTHEVMFIKLSRNIWDGLPVTGWPQFIGFMLTALALSTVVGILVYYLVEKPMTNMLRKWWRNTGWKPVSKSA